MAKRALQSAEREKKSEMEKALRRPRQQQTYAQRAGKKLFLSIFLPLLPFFLNIGVLTE